MAQKGFTLVEIMVILALSSIILTASVLTIQQIFITTERSNERSIALAEINRAAIHIKKDIQSSTTSNLTDLQVAPTTLEWTDHTGFTSIDKRQHSSSYSLSGKVLSNINADNVTIILGRNIESVIFSGSGNGTYIDVVITANNSTLPGRSEILSFSARMRTDE
ncbi:type II secretion system protein J [Chloroflexota bacterium]